MDETQIKEYLKKWYTAMAAADCSSCSASSCSLSSCPSASSGDPPQYIAWKVGYSPDDIESVPKNSISGLGCGNPVALADLKEGETVLDLGSGWGMDAFLASKKVGSTGKVIGVDMTEAMLKKAEDLASKHGYSNVEFRLGYIESLPVDDESVDVVISNCTFNLVPDKLKAFKEAYRVLKPNGRLVVSDLVTHEELPEDVRNSLDAWARCIGGALEKNSYLDKIAAAGFQNVKVVSQKPYVFNVFPELRRKIVSIQVEAHK